MDYMDLDVLCPQKGRYTYKLNLCLCLCLSLSLYIYIYENVFWLKLHWNFSLGSNEQYAFICPARLDEL